MGIASSILLPQLDVAENIMLAAPNEGLGDSVDIPQNQENDVVLRELGVLQGLTPSSVAKLNFMDSTI